MVVEGAFGEGFGSSRLRGRSQVTVNLAVDQPRSLEQELGKD